MVRIIARVVCEELSTHPRSCRASVRKRKRKVKQATVGDAQVGFAGFLTTFFAAAFFSEATFFAAGFFAAGVSVVGFRVVSFFIFVTAFAPLLHASAFVASLRAVGKVTLSHERSTSCVSRETRNVENLQASAIIA